MSKGRRPSAEKGLPPLPQPKMKSGMTMMDALAAHTRSIRINEEEQTGSLNDSLRSRGFTKSKGKMTEPTLHSLPSLSTDITPPYSSQVSPATPTVAAGSTDTRGSSTPISLDSTRSFTSGYDPKNPFGTGTVAGIGAGHQPPRSPSSGISQDSPSQSTTPRSVTGFMLGTRGSSNSTPPSFRSSATMPEMTAYNDVDQWGAPRGDPQPPTSPKREGLASSLGSSVGLRRKNSGGKLLVNGLSRSLTRMGSVMKRSTSDNNMNSSVSTKRKEWTRKRAATNRHSTVAEAEAEAEGMGEGWERVDMQREMTEGDRSITRPFNVAHDLHVSPDLGDLPPAWLEALKAQGLSEADLLLIGAARHKAAQRPLIKIVHGSTPPSNGSVMDAGSVPIQNHHHSRGMSTPAYLVNADQAAEQEKDKDKPLISKRFSWERSPLTPTNPTDRVIPSTAASDEPEPISPFRAFRQSLADSPLKADAPTPGPSQPESLLRQQYTHPYARTPTRSESPDSISTDGQPSTSMDETPKKTKRWSDQLRGFQSSFSSFGGDDDWGSQLTLALTGESGLQTVHEVDSRGPSLDSRRPDPVKEEEEEERMSGEGINDSGHQSTPTAKSRNTKSLSIQPSTTTPNSAPPGARSPPYSPRSPGGTRIRRKPVPANIDIAQEQRQEDLRQVSSPRRSIHSAMSERSYPGSPPPPWRKEKPSTPRSASGTPGTTPPSDSSRPVIQHATSYDSLGTPTKPAHLRSHSQSVTQQSQSTSASTESEVEHDLRTPSTNHHFFHSPSSSLSHPPLPRSISEESQFTSIFDLASTTDTPNLHSHSEHMLAAFSFPVKTQPPRSNPRYSMPASAGYTESSPPTRAPTPTYGVESESDEVHQVLLIPISIPAGISAAAAAPITPPRITKKISSRRNKIGTGCSPSAVLFAAGYESPPQPSTRPQSPSNGGSESEDAHAMLHYYTNSNVSTVIPAPPITPPRTKKTSSSRRNRSGTRHSDSPSAQAQDLRHAVLDPHRDQDQDRDQDRDQDPMNGWDQAHTIDERASIALSMISGSGETDPRSSMTSSLRDSLKDAKVLKAYTRDLSGVDEGTSPSETGSSLGVTAHTHNRNRNQYQYVYQAQASVRTAGRSGNSPIKSEAIYDAEPISPSQSQSQPPMRRSPPSTNLSGSSSRSSRRHKQSPTKTPPQTRVPSHAPLDPHTYQHPFAYRKDSSTSQYSTDDDPLRALEDAAKEIAKRTGRYQATLGNQRGGGGNGHGSFSDADE